MASKRGSGDLRFRYAFDKRVDASDGYGNTKGGWAEQFDVRAGIVHLRGGEDVMAGRLSGRHTQVVFVRASNLAKTATTDWRVRDVWAGSFVDGVWRGPSFNIRDITLSDDMLWLDFLVQSGGAN